MQISDCRFGSITIDGQTYTKDVIIHSGRVHPEWWRAKGHSLCMDDLTTILGDPPDVLVIGRGQHGVMKVPESTRQALADKGIELVDLKTPQAVDKFAELDASDRTVSAGFHLTC